jgi:hypothetical protein
MYAMHDKSQKQVHTKRAELPMGARQIPRWLDEVLEIAKVGLALFIGAVLLSITYTVIGLTLMGIKVPPLRAFGNALLGWSVVALVITALYALSGLYIRIGARRYAARQGRRREQLVRAASGDIHHTTAHNSE